MAGHTQLPYDLSSPELPRSAASFVGYSNPRATRVIGELWTFLGAAMPTLWLSVKVASAGVQISILQLH